MRARAKTPDRLAADLELAFELADLADALTTRHLEGAHATWRKADGSPASEVDLLVEREIGERLAKRRPGDGLLGEETGARGRSRRRWVVDPIDGTKNYVRGIPVFATQIALEVDGEAVVGVVSAPALGRRWWAAREAGAFADGAPIAVSTVSTLAESVFLFTPGLLRGRARDWVDTMLATCAHTRGLGNFWMHMLVAEGAADIAAYHTLGPWDALAVEVIVAEAGGRVWAPDGDLEGRPGLVSTNAALHDVVVESLAAELGRGPSEVGPPGFEPGTDGL